MDAFNLKKDNRRKFQDKQRLKGRHATPSDRKYHRLHREEQERKKVEVEGEGEDEDESMEKPLPSNEDRYTGDLLYVPPELDTELQETSNRANSVLRRVLEQRKDSDVLQEFNSHSPRAQTNRDVLRMNVTELNSLLGVKETASGRGSDRTKPGMPSGTQRPEPSSSNTDHLPSKTEPLKEDNKPQSFVPDDLQDDQDFLDDLL